MVHLNHRQKLLSWATAVLTLYVCLVLPIQTKTFDNRIWIRLAVIIVFYLALLFILRDSATKG
jgi:hypothetical protein